MDKNSINEHITSFMNTIHKEKKAFMLKQLEIMKGYCTEPILDEIRRIHADVLDSDAKGIEKIKHDKEAELFTVYTEEGLEYEVTASESGAPCIEDILLPCDCTETEAGAGKCPMCEGEGVLDDEEDAECPMCDGEGTCPNCEGEGIVSVRDIEAAHGHHHGPEEEPLSSAKELLEELEEWDNPNKKLATFLSKYLYELDKLYYKNYKEFQDIYRKNFNTEGFDYPHLLFPNYLPPILDEFTLEDDGNFYGTVEIGGEALLLSVEPKDDSFVIVAIESECTMYDHSPELHGDTYVECECIDASAHGKPDPECEACHGTGAIVCPICLGMGWIPIAPKSLTPEDIDDPERYRKGVADLYDVNA